MFSLLNYGSIFWAFRYCMRKLPKGYPRHWLCGACDGSNISNSRVKEDLPRTVASNLPEIAKHEAKVVANDSKLSGGARRNWHEKEVGKGKTKYLRTEEVIKMPSGDKKGELSSRVSRLSSSSSTAIKSRTRVPRVKPKSTVVRSSVQVKENPRVGPLRSPEYSSPPRPVNTLCNTKVLKMKGLSISSVYLFTNV